MIYTREDLDKAARRVAADIRKETGEKARFRSWSIRACAHFDESVYIELTVLIAAYDGMRQRTITL
jgi:alkylhydroperoxidase family enzyme